MNLSFEFKLLSRMNFALNKPENCHQNESRAEVRNNSSCVLLQFVIKCSRSKSSDRYVFKMPGFFIMPNRLKELIFPCGTSAN